ncbi:Nucleoside diphosphate kinase 7 [Cladochytrium tenue]|nr:Nucleoside diphosphate kinase 7 [Cladochytrium tenue]
MASITDPRYCFLVDWFDAHAQLARQYQLFFYPSDNTVEMYDIKQHRTFLKRTKTELGLRDLHVGSSVSLFSRQLAVKAYGDEYTANALRKELERTVLVIKPHATEVMGEILAAVQQAGFTVCRLQMMDISPAVAEVLAHDFRTDRLYAEHLASLTGHRALAVELTKLGAVSALLELAGPVSATEARARAPDSLRARFGATAANSPLLNAVHASADAASAAREARVLFEPAGGGGARLRASTAEKATLAVVKPHAVHDGLTGSIMAAIAKGGFRINNCRTFSLDKASAEEFLEVYKGVVPEYHLMLEQLISGMVVALEITYTTSAAGEPAVHVVSAFRELAGPADPEIGRLLRPRSLRAMFGKDKVHNAVHCTDLEDDGAMEVRYFFDILADA